MCFPHQRGLRRQCTPQSKAPKVVHWRSVLSTHSPSACQEAARPPCWTSQQKQLGFELLNAVQEHDRRTMKLAKLWVHLHYRRYQLSKMFMLRKISTFYNDADLQSWKLFLLALIRFNLFIKY